MSQNISSAKFGNEEIDKTQIAIERIRFHRDVFKKDLQPFIGAV
jgi:hypothetical protein